MLVLGSDALANFRSQLDALRAETDAWEKTSLSTAFSDCRAVRSSPLRAGMLGA